MYFNNKPHFYKTYSHICYVKNYNNLIEYIFDYTAIQHKFLFYFSMN